MKIINYEVNKYDFSEIIKDILEVNSLDKLHEVRKYDILTREKDQSTEWHRRYYDNFPKFEFLYRKFIVDFMKPYFNNEKIVFQKIPTFRVHLVGNLGVGDFHKDRDYNHGVNEINFWMPFTNTFGNNSIWLESAENKFDFHPVRVNYGQILEFDGANLLHGNKINDTNITRVSVDFRILKLSDFKPSENGSINMKSKFDIGGYFDVI
jgi:hypothetical protein